MSSKENNTRYIKKQGYITLGEINNYTCKEYCSCRNTNDVYNVPSLNNYSELTGKGYYNPDKDCKGK